jgi:hypothetical protein
MQRLESKRSPYLIDAHRTASAIASRQEDFGSRLQDREEILARFIVARLERRSRPRVERDRAIFSPEYVALVSRRDRRMMKLDLQEENDGGGFTAPWLSDTRFA